MLCSLLPLFYCWFFSFFVSSYFSFFSFFVGRPHTFHITTSHPTATTHFLSALSETDFHDWLNFITPLLQTGYVADEDVRAEATGMRDREEEGRGAEGGKREKKKRGESRR